MQDTDQGPVQRTAPGAPNKTKKVLFAIAYLVFLGLLLELGARAYLVRTEPLGWPALLRPGRLLLGYYPELAPVEEAEIHRHDAVVDVLLLGGSVMGDYGSGFIRPTLETRLAATLGRAVRIHNLAVLAHSSLDALHKYARLAGKRFDLVIYYEAINEARANNCPPDIFRDDYGHYAWYRSVGLIEQHRELEWLALPYVAHQLVLWGARSLRATPDVSPDKPKEDWIQFGADIKTAGPFERNITRIVAIARGRGDPLLLLTFAYHVASGYTSERFYAQTLDYDEHLCPIELWGKPENVAAAIDAHNAAIRRIFARFGSDRGEQLRLVDMERSMPKDKRYFDDICHLTREGSVKFVDIIMSAVLELIPDAATHSAQHKADHRARTLVGPILTAPACPNTPVWSFRE